MKPRPNLQFLAMQGDRLLGRSFLPTSSPAGKQAAPEVSPPAFGAADLSDNVRVLVRLVSEAEQISDGEVISRAVCHYAECHVGLPGLLGDFDRPAVNRHANCQSTDLQLVDGCLVDLPVFARSRTRFGVSAR
ncbi:hypothetical protein N7E70_015835 [Aminobacter sp. NyZ550]|uniref:hypothetical protein n=1 Tax=Aminobacter sp. NyZ550 TaxID=2979870 RepID=UPI0021D61340|nr:hypothetical protein [Aminobacter sp. NyZ550]WAX93168.1 hypothetical protein N7E70_015835 [Aminobacter sp. NyZ550]